MPAKNVKKLHGRKKKFRSENYLIKHNNDKKEIEERQPGRKKKERVEDAERN